MRWNITIGKRHFIFATQINALRRLSHRAKVIIYSTYHEWRWAAQRPLIERSWRAQDWPERNQIKPQKHRRRNQARVVHYRAACRLSAGESRWISKRINHRIHDEAVVLRIIKEKWRPSGNGAAITSYGRISLSTSKPGQYICIMMMRGEFSSSRQLEMTNAFLALLNGPRHFIALGYINHHAAPAISKMSWHLRLMNIIFISQSMYLPTDDRGLSQATCYQAISMAKSYENAD